jgi:TrmH family RNA methyltransferase
MPERVRVVLVETEGEVNLGFAARIAMNFGADEFYLVAPKANPSSPVSLRFAAHAKHVLEQATIVDSLDEALNGVELSACTSALVGYKTDVLRHPVTPRSFAELATRYRSVAIVFGRESVGLTRDEIAKCDLLVTIPANPSYPVLNLTHAMAVILYEVWLVRSGFREFHAKADADTLRRIIDLAKNLVERVVDEQRQVHVLAALKHCLSRCAPTTGEASNIYYLFKKLYHLVRG